MEFRRGLECHAPAHYDQTGTRAGELTRSRGGAEQREVFATILNPPSFAALVVLKENGAAPNRGFTRDRQKQIGRCLRTLQGGSVFG